ncbi:MAG: hypothetical protein HPY89_01290 [Pelotomaculum sp.]|uniref:Hypothetical membrane protein n=1 Tax=Pelotomaculum thermopropionicum (strain DSM 13744 / JCM 10971 / SI) TaxID=370438 RepID=A5D350_PELTS|nr:hypothetical protein [Pelotomaculum sp.]BAF59323.1 hypothetical membrane protein [Pelotomaculum thermopropionicum SI]
MNYRLNMLPDDLAPDEKSVNSGNPGMAVALLALLAGLAVWYGIFIAGLFKMKNDLNVLNSKIDELSPVYTYVLKTKNELEASRKYLALLEQMAAASGSSSAVLAGINGALPADVWLKSLQIMKGGRETGTGEKSSVPAQNAAPGGQIAPPERPDTVIIEGYTRAAPAVGALAGNLGRIQCFTEVSVEEVSYSDEKKALSFKIRAKFR